VFNQPTAPTAATVCRVTDVRGNRWVATAVEFAGGELRITTGAGAVVTYPSLAGVATLDFSQGNVTYLSDLPLSADLPAPFTDGPRGEWAGYRPRVEKDRSIDFHRFGPIAVGGRRFAKGLAIPPDATVTVPLNGGYREFRTVIGVHDLARAEYTALSVKVEVDGRVVLDDPLTRAGPPQDFGVGVKDARELKLTVTGPPALGNQVCFADARLLK
jgi:hypothetical protein